MEVKTSVDDEFAAVHRGIYLSMGSNHDRINNLFLPCNMKAVIMTSIINKQNANSCRLANTGSTPLQTSSCRTNVYMH
jgi:hypothetical protein